MPLHVDHIAVVLPAFNEEKDLPQLLQRLDTSLEKLRRPYHIVVVDDGSADRTAAIAADAAAKHFNLAPEISDIVVVGLAFKGGQGHGVSPARDVSKFSSPNLRPR